MRTLLLPGLCQEALAVPALQSEIVPVRRLLPQAAARFLPGDFVPVRRLLQEANGLSAEPSLPAVVQVRGDRVPGVRAAGE
jgi:hypothetical protein